MPFLFSFTYVTKMGDQQPQMGFDAHKNIVDTRNHLDKEATTIHGICRSPDGPPFKLNVQVHDGAGTAYENNAIIGACQLMHGPQTSGTLLPSGGAASTSSRVIVNDGRGLPPRHS